MPERELNERDKDINEAAGRDLRTIGMPGLKFVPMVDRAAREQHLERMMKREMDGRK